MGGRLHQVFDIFPVQTDILKTLRARSFGTVLLILIPVYKNNRTYRISDPKRTDSENRIADMTKIMAMRPTKSQYTIFPLKDRQKLSKEHN